MYEIIIGRNEEDRKKYGTKGTILLGKHFVKMGQTTSLSNNILMDVTKSHVVFVVGKRGTGKSYTMGVIAEGIANLPPEIGKNISIIMLDTMGVYWTMKYPNKKDKELLEEWELEEKGLNVHIFTPVGYYEKYRKAGIPTDSPFSIRTDNLDAYDWCMTFDISINEPLGVLIERAVDALKERGQSYDIDDIIEQVRKDEHSDEKEKNAVENRFLAAKKWGLFGKEGTSFKDLVLPHHIVVLDVSCYVTMPGSSNIRALVIGLIAEKLFIDRMVARKKEEQEALEREMEPFSSEEEEEKKRKEPLVWLVIDEAHEFLPNKGTTTATQPLITILREGRQPGISLILASQQPGKIHTDVMTQADIVIAHRVTANIDAQALGALMQTYMRAGLDKELNTLPRVKGAAIVFDDVNEKMYPMRVRPRLTWHGGEAPSAIPEKKKIFEF
jgi:hypothetical protein